MSSHARNDRRHLDGEPSDVDTAGEGAQPHLVFIPPPQERPRSRFAPKLSVEQRRAVVRMRSEGRTLEAVAQRFGVCVRSVRHLVGCGRYGGTEPVSHMELASSQNNVVDDSRRPAARRGVDLLIRGLPLENYRALAELAESADCSVADFTRELLACAAPPTPARRPTTVRRVGLRHLVSTWASDG